LAVLDFIGDMCKSLAWGICDAVVAVTFDKFHQDSAPIILARNAEIEYLEKKNEIVLKKQKESTAIEINKFQCNG